MGAYSVALNNGGAQKVIDMLTPEPVKAVEDTGSMALFMGDVSSLADDKLGADKSIAPEDQDLITGGNPEESGAAFAAQFALENEKK